MKSPSKIARAIYLLGQKNDSSLVSRAFLEYAENKHLGEMLPKIIYHLKNLSNKSKNYNTAFISSAFKTSQSDEKIIKNFTSIDDGSRIINEIDKDLIGGFMVKYRGYLYDASIKNKLLKLKEELINQQ